MLLIWAETRAVAQKENVSQAVEVHHNNESLDGPASFSEQGIRVGSIGPWLEGRLPTRHRVLGSLSFFAGDHHFFEAKGRAMRIPEVSEDIGVAVFIGTTVADKEFLCNVGELSQQARGLCNVRAEAADCFLSVHVTRKLVAVSPHWAAEAHPRLLLADVHMPGDPRQYIHGVAHCRAQVTHRGGHNAEHVGRHPCRQQCLDMVRRIPRPRRRLWRAQPKAHP